METALLTTRSETRVTRSFTRTVGFGVVAMGSAAGAVAMPVLVSGVAAAFLALPLVLAAILFGVATFHATSEAACPACGKSLIFLPNGVGTSACDGCAVHLRQSAGRVAIERQSVARHMRPEWQIAFAAQLAAEAESVG